MSNRERQDISNICLVFVSTFIITGDDVVGGFEKYSRELKECIHRLAKRYEEENEGESFFLTHTMNPSAAAESGTGKAKLMGKLVTVGDAEDNLL